MEKAKTFMRYVHGFIGIVLLACLSFLNFIFESRLPYSVAKADFGALLSVACQRIQTNLENYFGQNIALYRTGGTTAFIRWLLSPQNTRGFQRIDVESIPGKKRGVAFRVDLPYCFSLASLSVPCTATNIQYVDPSSGEMVFDLTADPYRHVDSQGRPVRLRFKEEDLMKYCTETDTSYIQNKIAQYLLEWEQAFDKVLTTLISTHVGTNAAAAAVTNVPIFIAGNNTTPGITVLNPDAVWYIDKLMEQIGNNGPFGMVGGTIVSKLTRAQKWVAANDAGVDLSKFPSQREIPFEDLNFNTTFGQSDLILFAPGTAQLVTWNKYKGEKRRQVTNLYSKGTVVLPATGLEIDWKWWYDSNCEEWIFEGFLHAELAVVPGGGCGTNMAGVNGILRVHDCGVTSLIPTCPT